MTRCYTEGEVYIENVYFNDFYRQIEIANLTEEFANESAIYKGLGFNARKFIYFIQGLLDNGWEIRAARVGRVLAGYVIFMAENEYVEKHNFEIMTIYTHPKFRNKGVARYLIKDMITLADERDCAYAQVSICAHFERDRDKINKLTANAFAKFGFEPIGIIMGRKCKAWSE